MIIVQIGRGLGNSMYTYAAALALANHHKTDLKIDTSYLNSWPRFEKYGGLWELELSYLNITSKEATKKELRKHVFKTGFRPIDKLIRKRKLFEKNVHYFPSHGSIEEFYNLPDDIYLWGYMGNERFFNSIKDIIKKEFTLKEEHKKEIMPTLKEISSNNSVSLHVRRGDVLKLKNARVLDLEYYKKATDIIKKKVKNPVFYVFSDDIPWCKENLKLGVPLKFMENTRGRGYIVLELMRNCKNNILANSALSWWSGYLNLNKNAVIVAPKSFSHFKNPKVQIKDKIKDDGWIRI